MRKSEIRNLATNLCFDECFFVTICSSLFTAVVSFRFGRLSECSNFHAPQSFTFGGYRVLCAYGKREAKFCSDAKHTKNVRLRAFFELKVPYRPSASSANHFFNAFCPWLWEILGWYKHVFPISMSFIPCISYYFSFHHLIFAYVFRIPFLLLFFDFIYTALTLLLYGTHPKYLMEQEILFIFRHSWTKSDCSTSKTT